jgi:hypothetical protein
VIQLGVKTVLHRVFSRLVLAPKVVRRDYSIRFPNVANLSGNLITAPGISDVEPIEKPGIINTPVISADVSLIDYGSVEVTLEAAHIEIPESRAEVVIGETGCQVKMHVEDFVPAVSCSEVEFSFQTRSKALSAPDSVVETTEPDIQFYGIKDRIKPLESEIETASHKDIRLAYGKQVFLTSIDPHILAKAELLYFWRALMNKVPYGSNKDLEMVGVFPSVEVDRFSSIKYDSGRAQLRLKPKPFHHQMKERGKRCDIIYGRLKPTGKLITAVLESD